MEISTSMFTNSVESDFIYLRYLTFSYVANGTYTGGVFAAETFQPKNIICQPRGNLIPIENASHFTLNNILTYNIYPPIEANGDDESESDRNRSTGQFILVDNTICSRIRFCLPTVANIGVMGSCGNAVLAKFSVTGLMFVKALSVIPAGTEIVVELHNFYNLYRESFIEQCQFDPHGCGISSLGLLTPKELGVVSSESFSLYLAPSSIPGVGVGLFSKFSIPPYNIITLCQGKVYDNKFHTDAEKGDRLTAAHKISTTEIVIQMDNFCGYTNDIIDINKFMDNRSYTAEDMKRPGSVPLLPGYAYNALQGGEQLRTSAIISIRHIPPHTEILQQYGESYWWYRYQKKHQKHPASRPE
jgi:hypothetical protein